MAPSMKPPAIRPRAVGHQRLPIPEQCPAPRSGPRVRCSTSRSSAQSLSAVARPDSPGAAGRSAGPPFRDRNGHEADDPSPKIGRHRAGRPCDRETIPTSFVETAVNQVIGTGPQRARPGARRQPSRRRQPAPASSNHSCMIRTALPWSVITAAKAVVLPASLWVAAFRLTGSLDQPRAARVTRPAGRCAGIPLTATRS